MKLCFIPYTINRFLQPVMEELKASTRFLFPSMFCLLISLFTHTSYAEVVVGINKPQQQPLPERTLRAIFSMRLHQWDDGQEITVFVLPKNNKSHIDFCKNKLGIFPYQLQRIIDKCIFSGQSQAPIVVKDSLEMLERLKNTPGSIGYLEKDYLDEGTNEIGVM